MNTYLIKRLSLLLLLMGAVALSGCTVQPRPGSTRPGYHYNGPAEIRDLREVPQDLTELSEGRSTAPLLSKIQQQSDMARFRAKFFSPWKMMKPSVRKNDVAAAVNARARGWKEGGARWTDEERGAIRANARLASWPNSVGPGICIRAANLREIPTNGMRFSKPVKNGRSYPFDLFQYSLLHVGTPVLMCHTSADGRWVYVETSVASGWVEKNSLATVSPDFIQQWQRDTLACVISEHVQLGQTGRSADIGAVLPLMSMDGGSATVLVPGRTDNFQAKPLIAELAPGEAAKMPMPMTGAAVAALGNAMMGQRYGWGGMYGLRDCSATTRDLMAPFGIWLPRNSRSQGRTGQTASLIGMTPDDKERVVLSQGVPMASLLVMNGHVVLYAGTWNNRPVIFHNLWGIRVTPYRGGSDRVVVGRAVVTTMQPGRELPNLAGGQTIGNRFHTLTVLGGAAKP